MKTSLKLLMTFAIAGLSFVSVQAQNRGNGRHIAARQQTTLRQQSFIDNNNDGICDRYTMRNYAGKGPGVNTQNQNGLRIRKHDRMHASPADRQRNYQDNNCPNRK